MRPARTPGGLVMELWRNTFQISIDAYYSGDLERGLDACEALLASDALPPDIELQTRRNLVFYARPLDDLLPGVDTWPVHIPASRGQRSLYPSVANGGHDLRMLVWPASPAASSGSQNTGGNVTSAPAPSVSLLSLAADLDIRDVRTVHDRGQPAGLPALMGSGADAAQLFHHAGSWWICTSGGGSSIGSSGQVTLLRLDGDAVHHRQHLSVDSSRSAFRNWMPAASEGEDTLRFVASMSPLQLVRYLGADGVAPVSTYPGPPLLRWCRGGTQLLRVADGWLGVVREVVDFDGGGHANLHRFVWLGADWFQSQISSPWIFQSHGAEVAGGIALWGNDLIISYGREDHGAWLAIMPLAKVMRLLGAPLDTDAARRRLRREAATAVAPGALPAPAQPAPVPATIDAQASLITPNGDIAPSGDVAAPDLSLSPQTSQVDESQEPKTHDLATFSGQMLEHVDDATAYSGLAEALAQAGRLDEAIAAFRICASLAEGAEAEMGAWAMYRAAECFLAIGRPADAVEALALGMAKHAGLGELPWLAAYASWQANRPAQAAYWARRAIALGRFAGAVDMVSRNESRHPTALWEGPFDILRFALRRLGDDAGADEAESLFQAARSAREAVT
jgi:hypothetical protein